MKQKWFLGFLPAFCLVALAHTETVNAACEGAAKALVLGEVAGEFGSVVDVPVTLTSDADVQGLVAAFDWDGAVGTGVDLIDGAALAGAEVVQRRVEADYMVLGVVIDIDGVGPDAIPSGAGIDIATAQIRCGPGPAESSSPIEFRDGTYATVDGGPALDNILVVGGLSIGVSDSLCLGNGSLRCTPPPDRISVPDASNPANGADRCGTARILLDNNRPVEGFVVALCHGAGLTLDSVVLGGAAASADFFQVETSAEGFTAGVVIDLIEPFVADFAIPPGAGQMILGASYCCPAQAANSPDRDFALDLCDGVLGTPIKDNILVIGGQSIGVSDDLLLVDGTFTCHAPTREIIEPGVTKFLCSGRGGAELSASAGGSVEVCFAVQAVEDNVVGHAQPDHIQGFSMAVTFCDALTCNENLDISGTILEALGAEFVSIQCDNDDGDGDGRELIIGVLIDATPPFDGATIAPSPEPQPIGYVTFDIAADAECGAECPIEFVDNINGRGRVPIKNLVSAENKSRSPTMLVNCVVTILHEERFYRGDCNFSLMGSMAVEIADAAAVVSYLFLPGSWQFQPGCLDACDCNDDGRVDLADSVCVLQYLFLNGRTPPSPGPGWDPESQMETEAGADPTDDKLDCPDGQVCELVGD